SYTVIGIMPANFRFPSSAELWVPLGADLSKMNRGKHYLFAIGRIKDGISLKVAQAEMDSIARSLAQEYPDNNKDRGVNLVPLLEEVVGKTRPALLVLLAAVGLVLLIACANVANLLLARAASRQREIAIRAALGASRLRLIRQFLTESLLLSLLGGGLGLLFALWGIDLLTATNPGDLPRISQVKIDGKVLGFTMLISIFTGLAFGLAPALHALRLNPNSSLKESALRASTGVRQLRLRSLLVIGEVALALVLLIAASLLINSFINLYNVDPGFDAKNVFTMQLSLPEIKYVQAEQQAAFFQQVLERIKAIDGVQSVGAVNDLPFSGSRTSSSFEIKDTVTDPESSFSAGLRKISPDYFRVMNIPLLNGRYFTEQDSKDGVPAVIINEAMAKRFWPGQDPLGKQLSLGMSEEEEFYGKKIYREVIGVVGNIKHDRLDHDVSPEMYVPYLQLPASWMSLVVRTNVARNPIADIRSTVQALDKDQPIYNINTMEQRLARSISAQRFNSFLLGTLALIALILSTIGIYGVISYSVNERTQEIGIRLALGAQQYDILRLIVGQGMFIVLIGIIVGLAVALALTRLMTSLLYGVSTSDPVIFIGVSLILVIVALLASYIPARRASRVDPMIALRYE
ncbi:MAG: ABC transporter permease, partial [Acidobacteriota bacterium]